MKRSHRILQALAKRDAFTVLGAGAMLAIYAVVYQVWLAG